MRRKGEKGRDRERGGRETTMKSGDGETKEKNIRGLGVRCKES